MRGAIGPILTTGVALAAAGVVVANPIITPRADVQIPAVQLSAGGTDPAAMLDQAFLDAIAPAPPESTNPFSVLRQLISSLAADATYLGKNAIVDAFVAGVTAVSQPELTAVSTPYFPVLSNSPELAASVLPGLDPAFLTPFTDAGTALSQQVAIGTGAVAPVVQTLVTSVVSDAGFVGGQLVAAAFAAGALVAAEPMLIGATLNALLHGDLNGAVQNAVNAVTAPLGPPVIILNALRAVVEKNLTDVAAALGAAVPAVVDATLLAPSPQLPAAETAPVESPTVAMPALSGRGPEGMTAPTTAGDAVQTEPVAVTEQIAAEALQPRAAEARATTTSAPTGPDAAEPSPAGPGAALRNAIEAVGQQIGAALTAPATASAGNAAGVRGKSSGGARVARVGGTGA